MTSELPPKPMSVRIHGRTYQLRVKDDPQYVENLVKIVNDKMSEVEATTQTVDSIRVAVLTALNLADQQSKQQTRLEARIRELEDEQQRLHQLLDQALSGTD